MTFRPLLLLCVPCAAFADSLNHAADDELALAAAQLISASQRPAGIAAASATTVTNNLAVANCAGVGQWGSAINWTPHIPVSAANLPDGRILTFASNQRTSFPVGPEFTYAATWNPATGAFQEFNHGSHDMFCGGITLMPDGRVMVNGGRNETPFASIFDWRTNTWTRVQNMNGGRWYNTTLSLANGQVFTATGSGTGLNTTERWSSTAGWTTLTGLPWNTATTVGSDAGYFKHWHPFLSVAPDGRVMHYGPTDTMHWFTVTGTGSATNSGTTVPGAHYPKEGAFAMYEEGRALVMGGSANTNTNPSDSSTGTSTTLAYTVDMRTSTPVVASTASMANARQFANAVVLPSCEVMVIGGNTSGLKFNDTGSVMTCEVWNPNTGAWRNLAPITVPRNYHSIALLLPDGRVLSGGGGLGGADHQDAQLFTPPCLFNANNTLATRPVLSTAPAIIGPSSAFSVTGTAGLARFSFIRMAALTHSVNTDQRFLSLPFTETTPGNYTVTAHANVNVMLPGHWMLFGVQPNGVYSVAKIIHVQATPPLSLTNPGAQFTQVNTATTLQLSANAPTGTTVTYGATGLPTGLTLNASTGLITGAPQVAGAFDVAVTATQSGGLTTTATFSWTVFNPVMLNPPAAAPPIAAGSAASYTAQSTGGVNVRYTWSWGDGSANSTGASPNHTFTSAGRYLISITATDDTGRVVTDSFYQAVYAPATTRRAVSSSSIVFEDRAAGINDRVWCVNADNDSVSVFDAVTRQRLAEITVGTAPRTIALNSAGNAWVTNTESDTISVISGTNFTVTQTITLARGSRPFGVIMDPDGTDAWITCEGTRELLRYAPLSGIRVAQLNLSASPRHLSVSGDGARLLISRFVTAPLPGESTATVTTSATTGGEVVSVLTAGLTVERTTYLLHSERADTITTGRGIPNYLGPAIISPDGGSAWVPSKQDNVKRGSLRDGQELTHDQTVRSIASRIILSSGATATTDDTTNRVDFDNAGIAVNGCFDPRGVFLFTALEGSREVGVVDVWNKTEARRFTAGRAPQGIVTSPDGRTVFVHNFMDRSITVHDASALTDGLATTPTLIATMNSISTEKLTATVLLGKKHFYDSADARIAFQGYISCASCHNDGGHDGRVWDFTGSGEGLRNTITLRGHAGMAQGPLHWSGNFDEVQDFEHQIRGLNDGTGLIATGTPHPHMGTPNAGRSNDLDALAQYVASLTRSGRSTSRTSDTAHSAAGEAGKLVFRDQQCANCHSGAQFTDSALNVFHDIGTQKASSGRRLNGTLTGLDTPTLRGVADTAPYLHDGSAATLEAAILAHSNVPKPTAGSTAMTNLITYLREIEDNDTPPASNTAPTITNPGPQTSPRSYADTLQISASDPEGQSLTFTATRLPLGLTISAGTGLISGTVSPTAAASNSTTITVSDGQLSASTSFDWVTYYQYPATFGTWVTSEGLSASNPTGDSDNDGRSDLIEYALGTSPSSGVQPVTRGLSITTDGAITLKRPTQVSDVSFTLESSNDLTTWTAETITPNVTTAIDGDQLMRWTNPARRLARVRAQLTSGAESVTGIVGTQSFSLSAGYQSVGLSLVKAPLYLGTVQSIAGSVLTLTRSAGLSTALTAGDSAYAEVMSGTQLGHRLHLSAVSDTAITADLTAAASTLRTLPTDLIGARIVVRPHMKLADACPVATFSGTNNPSASDQVLTFRDGAYSTYWRFGGSGTTPAGWLRSGDGSLTSQNSLIVPAGTGMLVKTASGTRVWSVVGYVRDTSFVQPLAVGHSLIASPWPIDRSPRALGMNSATFTGTNNPATSDQLLRWSGDVSAASAAWQSYWLLSSGTTREWLRSGSPDLTPRSDETLLPVSRAVFIKATPTTAARTWVVPMP